MLTKKQISEIRDHLNRANEPLFLFDNDPDGLCSFLLLQKYVKKGKGFPIRSFPELNADYFRKIKELNPDYVFILDKPVVSNEFLEKVHEVNLPVVWIDHHETDVKKIPDFVDYYNPLYNRKKSSEPVTALCYQINPDKKLAWLATVGCISDRFFPKFYPEVRKDYPDLTIDSKDPFDLFYNSQIGKIARMFGFALKDKTTNVIIMIKFLIKANAPYEVLNESPQNRTMHKRFRKVDSKYQRLIKKALRNFQGGRILFFKYGGMLSISSDLSNFLSYKFPDKIIVVIYVSGIKANISVRGIKVKDKVLEVLEKLEGATGGGHENAVGAQVRIGDIEKFKEGLEDLANEN